MTVAVEASVMPPHLYCSHVAFPHTTKYSQPGKFECPLLPGGGGWSLIRRDEVLEVDVRLILETDDKH